MSKDEARNEIRLLMEAPVGTLPDHFKRLSDLEVRHPVTYRDEWARRYGVAERGGTENPLHPNANIHIRRNVPEGGTAWLSPPAFEQVLAELAEHDEMELPGGGVARFAGRTIVLDKDATSPLEVE